MNSWTISRRISAGFASVLIITFLLGAFALWRLHSLRREVTELSDAALPSVLILNETGSLSRDNMVLAQEFILAGTEEERLRIEKEIAENRAQIDELYRQYAPLVSDAEDRRLFDDTKRTRAAFATVRNRLLELVRQNRVEESRKWLAESVFPAYEAAIQAVKIHVAYNNKEGMAAGNTGKRDAESGVHIIGFVLVLALGVNGFMAWLVVRSTNRVLRDLAGDLDQGSVQTAAAARQVSASSQSLSSGASEQAASVEETSASLEEMASMIRSTAENAQKAKALARPHAAAKVADEIERMAA